MATSYYFWGTLKSGFANRDRKDSLLMHAPYFFHVFSFLFTTFFLFVLSLLLVSYCSPAVGCSLPPFWSFLFLGTSLWVLTTLLPWVFPLKCFPPMGLPLSVFFSLPLFFPLPFGPHFSAVVTFLLQQTDSMRFLPFTPRASPTVFDLLWASFQDYPPTHWLPLPLLNTCLLHCYSFHDKIPFCLFLLYTSISLPSFMACIR